MTAVLRALTVIIISSRRWLHDAVWRWGLPLEELRVVVCECGVSVGRSEMSPERCLREKKKGMLESELVYFHLFVYLQSFPATFNGQKDVQLPREA
jgi:hypothetical protein